MAVKEGLIAIDLHGSDTNVILRSSTTREQHFWAWDWVMRVNFYQQPLYFADM
jgi:hypothetical protein